MKQQVEADTLNTRSFRNLLIFLLIYLFGSPFLAPYPSLAILAHLMLSATLFFAIYSVARHMHHRSIAMAMLPMVLILYWLGIYEIIHFSKQGAFLMEIFYFGLLIWSYISQLRRVKRITLGVLYATLCFYLIMGMMWGAAYALMYAIDPGSFSGSMLKEAQGNHLIIFNYFSMVTLTTLGYGDITPQTPSAGALCQLEAIFGQYFIAVIIAWLVSNYTSDRQESSDTSQKQ